MTLRARLLLGLVATLGVFAIGVIYTITSQRAHLLDQVDDQLESTPLQPFRPGPAPAPNSEPPISDLYLATVTETGSVLVFVEGQLIVDRPMVDSLVADPPAERALVDVDGEDGMSRFRVLYIPATPQGPVALVAVPLDDVDDTMNQLILTFVLVGAAIAAALAAVAFWVDRLAVRPITEMTAAADAIAAGERDRRVEQYGTTTEAGRLSGALNVMLDERDETEDRLRQFVSNASHELRTPLTSLRGYLDLYAEGGFRGPGQLDDAVRRMQGESARMNLLVDDLLLLAKLDEQQALDRGRVDVAQLLGDIAASAQVAAPGRTVQVAVEADLAVEADTLRLQQALAGVVDNAITHTPATATVRLEARGVDDGIEIVISDNGPGLTQEEADRAFDRFYRGDPSRSRAAGGSGLGLSITKSIVEAHGGHIAVTSEPGEGAVFTVKIPRA